MNRRDWIKLSACASVAFPFLGASKHFIFENPIEKELRASSFGDDFLWGTACAAYQIEGAWDQDGRGPSIWDTFSQKKGNVHNNENGNVASDFYNRYKEDIALNKKLNFKVFRFSISWSRIFPDGTGEINKKGVAFYHKVIDECIKNGIQPWITLYHWDLPQKLEDKGGWANRDILDWFLNYVDFCTKEFGSKVQNWMVMNEPAAFVGIGYMMGYHAPGKKSVVKFLKATHHVCLAMAEGGRKIRENVLHSNIGTTFSCSHIDPYRKGTKDKKSVDRMDALLNRLYIEPSLGMGYPYDSIPALKKIEKYFEPGDEDKLVFDFDFVGLQNYFRVVSKKSMFPPFLWAKQISAEKRKMPVNEMGFEIYPEGIYKILKQFSEYKKIKNIIVTENGACFKDVVTKEDKIHDEQRVDFFKSYLSNILKAKNEGVPVSGYFVWSLTDNFEWSEGYEPRFGLIHIDFETQKRLIKDSGYWFQKFLST